MPSMSEIRWGQYSSYEGPYFIGKNKLNFEPKDLLEKAILVTTEAEGGSASNVNMYDSGIVTLGAIQFIDRDQFGVCDLIGVVADRCGIDYVNNCLKSALFISTATFKQNAKNQWRFFLDNGKTEVNTTPLQQKLYLTCNGKIGSYSSSAISHAKIWCLALASLFDNDDALDAQIKFTKQRIMSFCFGSAKKIYSDPDATDDGYQGMLRAAIVSFCVNSPSNVCKAITNCKSIFPRWSKQWCLDILHAIVFVGVNTFNVRYNAIRPILEKQFNITLPQKTFDLTKKEWQIINETNNTSLDNFIPSPMPIPVYEPDEPKDDIILNNDATIIDFFIMIFKFLMQLFGSKK